jgi:hypothetical protein
MRRNTSIREGARARCPDVGGAFHGPRRFHMSKYEIHLSLMWKFTTTSQLSKEICFG